MNKKIAASICCNRRPEWVRSEEAVFLFCGNPDCDSVVYHFLPYVDLNELVEWWNTTYGRIDINHRVSLARIINRKKLPKRLHHQFEQANFYTTADIERLDLATLRKRFGLSLGEIDRLLGTKKKRS